MKTNFLSQKMFVIAVFSTSNKTLECVMKKTEWCPDGVQSIQRTITRNVFNAICIKPGGLMWCFLLCLVIFYQICLGLKFLYNLILTVLPFRNKSIFEVADQ